MWGKCYESGKDIQTFVRSLWVTWSGGIAAEVIDGCPFIISSSQMHCNHLHCIFRHLKYRRSFSHCVFDLLKYRCDFYHYLSNPKSAAPRAPTISGSLQIKSLLPSFSSTALTTPGFLATPPVIINVSFNPTRFNKE